MKINEFSLAELEEIKVSISNRRSEIWDGLKNRIKDQSFENIAKVYQNFLEIKNPYLVEGRCNIILEKISEFELSCTATNCLLWPFRTGHRPKRQNNSKKQAQIPINLPKNEPSSARQEEK